MNQNRSISLKEMPEYLSSEHLVELGIFSSRDATYKARISGHSPKWLKLRHRVLYSKKDVIEFLESRMKNENFYSSPVENATTKERE